MVGSSTDWLQLLYTVLEMVSAFKPPSLWAKRYLPDTRNLTPDTSS
jgi:hypothetical protein